MLLAGAFFVLPAVADTGTALRKTDNAATKYYQAFLQLPRLDDEDEQVLYEWDSTAFGKKEKDLLESTWLFTALDFLRRGAELTSCDWGLNVEDGPAMLVGHLMCSRRLARIAFLRGRYRLESGRIEEGLADFRSGYGLAHHVGTDNLEMSRLVQISIESMMVGFAAENLTRDNLGRLDAETLDRLKGFFKDAQKRRPLQPVLRFEKTSLCDYIAKSVMKALVKDLPRREKKELIGIVEREGSTMQTLAKIIRRSAGEEEGIAPARTQDAAKAFGDSKMVSKMLEESNDDPAEAVAKMFLQFEECFEKLVHVADSDPEEVLRIEKQMLEVSNPLVTALLGVHARLRFEEAKIQTKYAMLEAGVLIMMEGPQAVSKVRDPYGDGQFEYRKLDKGFELVSDLKHRPDSAGRRAPVVLAIGAPEKER